MLTKQDISLLKGMFETYKKDTITEMRDETRSMIAASENRIITRMDSRFDEYHKKIVGDIGSIIDDSVLPQIANLQHEVVRIKRHVKLA